MVRSSNEADKRFSQPAEDSLGRLIRCSLEDVVSKAEPAADVWPRILEQVKQMGQPAPSRRRFLSGLAPLMQAVVVSSLLLAFGLGLDRTMVVPRTERQAVATPAVRLSVASDEKPQDVLSGYVLSRLAKEPLPRRSPRGYIREP
jgi:hypothetical protein